jgi:C4-dicarboxylate-specific signal transduction histidine kinase
LSLIGFANAIKVLPAKQSQSPETMSDLLSSRGSNFESDYWITFIDPKGNAVASSTGANIVGMSYADRDYFQSTSTIPAKASCSLASRDRQNQQKEAVFLSRRVESAKGEFLGLWLPHQRRALRQGV